RPCDLPARLGLAHGRCGRSGAALWMSMTEYLVASLWSSRQSGSGPNGKAAVEHFARHGLTAADAQEQIRRRAGYYPGLVPAMPARYTRLLHGDDVLIGGRPGRVIRSEERRGGKGCTSRWPA